MGQNQQARSKIWKKLYLLYLRICLGTLLNRLGAERGAQSLEYVVWLSLLCSSRLVNPGNSGTPMVDCKLFREQTAKRGEVFKDPVRTQESLDNNSLDYERYNVSFCSV